MEPSSSPSPTDIALRQHGAFVRSLARSLVSDASQADDVAQDAWTRWVQQPPRTANERGWFRTVVHNLVTNMRRGDARRAQHEEHAARPEALRSSADESQQAELLGKLVAGVLALEPAQRDTLVALYFRGLDAPTLAAESGVPLATVRDRQQRALAKLRERLDRDFDGRAAWAAAMLRFAGEPSASLVPRAGAASTALKLLAGAGALAAGVAVWSALTPAPEPLDEALAAAPLAATTTQPAPAETPRVEPAAQARREPSAPALAPTASASAASGSSTGSQALTGGGPATAEVRGRFVLSGGAPAAGVHVVLSLGSPYQRAGEPDRDPAPPADWQDVVTDSAADGSFALSFPLVPSFTLDLDATAPGLARARWSWMDIAAGQVRELGDVVLRAAATVEGRIVDAQGQPCLGAVWNVSLDSVGLATQAGREELNLNATTDPATGAFRIEGAMPGANRLAARTEMWGRAELSPLVLGEGELAHVDLSYTGPDLARRIVLTVLTKQRGPRTEPEVALMRLLGAGAPRNAVKIAGSSASYAFDDLDPGTYSLDIDDPRFHTWNGGTVSTGTAVRAALTGSSSLALDVVDAATQAPVELYSVRLDARHSNSFPNQFDLHSGATPLAGGLLADLVAGEYTLIVTAGARSGQIDFELAAGETRALHVELHDPTTLSGHVRDATGAPCAELELLLLRPAAAGDSDESPILRANSMTSNDENFRKELAHATTGADGAFQLSAPREGSYYVAAVRAGEVLVLGPLQTLALGESRTGLELVLAQPGSLAGVVHAPAGRSTLGMRVLVAGAGLAQGPQPELTLDAGGAFEVGNLRPGSYHAYLLLPETIQHTDGGWMGSNNYGWSDGGIVNSLELGSLAIAEGAELAREFSPTLAEWPGTLELLVRVNGAPIALAHVNLLLEGNEFVDVGLETDAEGRIAGALIFAGSWRVTVKDPRTGWSATLPESLPVFAGRATVRTLDLERP